MTDLLHTLPDFPTKHYTHLLPSLEKNLITTTDLLTLDVLDVAKRARLPLLDVRRLKEHVLASLQGQLGLKSGLFTKFEDIGEEQSGFGALRRDGVEVAKPKGSISTLDSALDAALGGGFKSGYVSEIAGESGAGKTQLLLSLLLSAQLSPSHGGVGRPTIYISTEHPLPTTRLTQILSTNSILLSQTTTAKPSLSRILTLQTPDLESQEHILTYQLPIALSRHKIGLVVIDSVAANYRAEKSTSAFTPAALATRSAQLIQLGTLLRKLAREYNCAIVVANQVGDRFGPPPSSATSNNAPSVTSRTLAAMAGPNALFSSSPASTPSGMLIAAPAPSVLSLDHQQRFFTGWGDAPPQSLSQSHQQNLKTPSLGHVWANQIACRIALVKEEAWDRSGGAVPAAAAAAATERERAGGEEGVGGSAEWTAKKWRRWMRLVFAPWAPGCVEGDMGVEFEVWGGGVRGIGDGGGEATGG